MPEEKKRIVQCIHVTSLWSKDRIQERNEDAGHFYCMLSRLGLGLNA